jgi:N-acetylmuramoyl-L-alanine amidase
LLICGLAIIVAASRLAGQAPALQLLSREGRRPIPITTVGSQDMVALEDLASAFQLAVRDDGGAITVGYKGRSIVLTPDQTIASVAGRLISLPVPPVRQGNRWLVPLDFINRALASIYDARLDLRRGSRLLVIGDLRVPRVAVRHEVMGAAARVTLEVAPAATPAISQQDNTRLVVHIDADALDLNVAAFQPNAFVQGIRSLDATSIAIDLGSRFNTFRSATLPMDDGVRVTIDIAGAQTEASPTPAPGTAPPAPAPADVPPLDLPLAEGGIRTVAIDAGHGGTDVGAKGVNGTLEKNVSLAVARRLKATLEGRLGVRVVMTRDDDRMVPIESRTALANNNKADLFVSLHANASFRPEVSGATVYVASFSDAELARGRLGSERLPVFGGGSRSVDVVPWNLAQIPHRSDSEQFAQMVVSTLGERVPVSARPVEHAPLRLLESANMPAVLLEIGYLTNTEQERALAGAELQNAVTQALFDAVARFRQSAAPLSGQEIR